MNIDTNIRSLKGVGEIKAQNLYKMGIQNVYDLITHYPREYENRQKIKEVRDFIDGENALFFATISSPVTVRYIRKNLSIYSCFALDDNFSTIKLIWFNQKYIRTRVKQGIKYLFYGKTELSGQMYEVNSPSIYNLNQVEDIKGLYPVYPLTYGVSNNYIYKLEKQALSDNIKLDEVFNKNFREKYDLLEVNDAIKKIHFPSSLDDIKFSRNRFIFEELFFLQLALRTLRRNNDVKLKENKFDDVDTTNFENLLPYNLTDAQKRVIEEIKQDLKSNHVMNRMIQGDVGSRKNSCGSYFMLYGCKKWLSSLYYGSNCYSCNTALFRIKRLFYKTWNKCRTYYLCKYKKTKRRNGRKVTRWYYKYTNRNTCNN